MLKISLACPINSKEKSPLLFTANKTRTIFLFGKWCVKNRVKNTIITPSEIWKSWHVSRGAENAVSITGIFYRALSTASRDLAARIITTNPLIFHPVSLFRHIHPGIRQRLGNGAATPSHTPHHRTIKPIKPAHHSWQSKKWYSWECPPLSRAPYPPLLTITQLVN